MPINFSDEFKHQAVQKVLSRSRGVTIEDIATSLGVSVSTINRWKLSFQRSTLPKSDLKIMATQQTEKRPEDWTKEQRFNAIVACHALSEEQINAYCRSQGIYLHHIEQWKLEFLGGHNTTDSVQSQQKVRQLAQQNQKLKRDLTRKDKALAETAALLVLQKKVQDIWSEDEDS